MTLTSLTVTITAAVAVKPSTVYSVKVDDLRSDQSWSIRRCYSDFYRLRHQIHQLLQDIQQCTQGRKGIHFPILYEAFPKRHLVGSRSSSVISHRVISLQEFLRTLLSLSNRPEITCWPPVHDALIEYIEEFLSCPTSASSSSNRKRAQSCLPIEPKGRLLTGKELNNTFSPTSSNWSLAGDAVGLWAASANQSNQEPGGIQTHKKNLSSLNVPELRRLRSDSCFDYSSTSNNQPIVFRELNLDRHSRKFIYPQED